MQISTIGLDLAKNVFQAHGVDIDGKVVITKQLRRGQVLTFFTKLSPCLVGMEACATAHYWARELTKIGHSVRLMPPSYVKAYVKRSKNDAADAAAICEAVTRPSMRFVPIKTVDQQAALMLHRSRELFIGQRTQDQCDAGALSRTWIGRAHGDRRCKVTVGNYCRSRPNASNVGADAASIASSRRAIDSRAAANFRDGARNPNATPGQ